MNRESFRFIPLVVVFLLVLICISPAQIKWEFDLLKVFFFDLLQLCLATFILPLVVAKPGYKGGLLSGTFFPISSSWPVWLFWFGLYALAAHLGCLVKGLFFGTLPGFHIMRVALLSVWLWVVYSGRIRLWRSTAEK